MSDEIKKQNLTHHHLTNFHLDDYPDEKQIVADNGNLVTVEEVKIAEDALLMADEYTEEQYKKLKRKVDWILLPLMWWCYGIQQTDKTGLGTMVCQRTPGL